MEEKYYFFAIRDASICPHGRSGSPSNPPPSKPINNDFPPKPLQYQKKNVPLHIRNNAAVAAIKKFLGGLNYTPKWFGCFFYVLFK